MRDKAVEHINELIGEANASGLALLFSLKQDFPSEWHRFLTGTEDFKALVKQEHFPYFTQGKEITIDTVQLNAIKTNKIETKSLSDLNLTDFSDKLKENGEFELSLPADTAILKRDKDAIVFILVKYSLG